MRTVNRVLGERAAVTPERVGLTHQHTNRSVLVEGPEITIRPVGTRRLVAGGSR